MDIGYVAARQRAIELAMVIDEDCMELGIERSPTGVASWGDNRRPLLYWVGSDPGERVPVLMYECQLFFENDCERLPTSLEAVEGLLVKANETCNTILCIKLPSFEHVGSPLILALVFRRRLVRLRRQEPRIMKHVLATITG